MFPVFPVINIYAIKLMELLFVLFKMAERTLVAIGCTSLAVDF